MNDTQTSTAEGRRERRSPMEDEAKKKRRRGFNPHSLLSIPRAANACGLSPTTLRELVKDGRIPRFRPNKQDRVKVRDVQAYLEKCYIGPNEETPEADPEGEAELSDRSGRAWR